MFINGIRSSITSWTTSTSVLLSWHSMKAICTHKTDNHTTKTSRNSMRDDEPNWSRKLTLYAQSTKSVAPKELSKISKQTDVMRKNKEAKEHYTPTAFCDDKCDDTSVIERKIYETTRESSKRVKRDFKSVVGVWPCSDGEHEHLAAAFVRVVWVYVTQILKLYTIT